METRYKKMKGLKAGIGGLAILAGIGCLEIADRNTPRDIPVYTSAKRYIGEKAISAYFQNPLKWYIDKITGKFIKIRNFDPVF